METPQGIRRLRLFAGGLRLFARRLDVEDIQHLIHVFIANRSMWAACTVEELVRMRRERVDEARAAFDIVSRGLVSSGARGDRRALQHHLRELGRLAVVADAPGASPVATTYVVARALVPGEPAMWKTQHYMLLGTLVGFYDPGEEDECGVEASCALTRTYVLAWDCLASSEARLIENGEFLMLSFAFLFGRVYGLEAGVRYFCEVMFALAIAFGRGCPRGLEILTTLYACLFGPDHDERSRVLGDMERLADETRTPPRIGRLVVSRPVAFSLGAAYMDPGLAVWTSTTLFRMAERMRPGSESYRCAREWLLRYGAELYGCVSFASVFMEKWVVYPGAAQVRNTAQEAFLSEWVW
eukprot:jgi/Mesvir1/2587/Mv09247-RA.1